jgi:hypothetical protein
MSLGWIIAGVVALLIGGVTLVRPDLVRAPLGLGPSEAATYALRIAGMMLAAFGMLLLGFAASFAMAGDL